MKRGGFLRRYTRLRAKVGVRKVAKRRQGLTTSQNEAVDELARAVCMVSAGAAMIAPEGRRKTKPQWWGRCAWCKREGWLQWCHIRSRGSAPALVHDPLNAWAGCSSCHMGRQHDVEAIQDPFGPQPEMTYEEFIATIRTPDAIAYLRAEHKGRDVVLQAVANVATLEGLTRGHVERALWPEHLAIVAELIDRPDLAERGAF